MVAPTVTIVVLIAIIMTAQRIIHDITTITTHTQAIITTITHIRSITTPMGVTTIIMIAIQAPITAQDSILGLDCSA